MIELKWSYELPGKVFESAWDAVKLALLGPEHGCEGLYVVTGASLAGWVASESADLFSPGTIHPAELWARSLVPRRGPNYGATVGEDLEIGGHGNRPLAAPESIAIRSVGAFPVARDYELRVIGVNVIGHPITWPSLAP